MISSVDPSVCSLLLSLCSYSLLMVWLIMLIKPHLILIFVSINRLNFVWILCDPRNLILVAVLTFRTKVQVLVLDHLIEDCLNLACSKLFSFPVIHLELFTDFELVIFHIEKPQRKFIGFGRVIALKKHSKTLKTSFSQELIFISLISHVLGILSIGVCAALIEAIGACLIHWESYFRLPFNQELPFITIG